MSWIKDFKSSPIVSERQVVCTAIISGLYISKIFLTEVLILLLPPNTDAPSVKDEDEAIAGSLKWRDKTILWYEQQPCEPWLWGMHFSTPSAANIAPTGWQVLQGLILRASRSFTSLGVKSSIYFSSSK